MPTSRAPWGAARCISPLNASRSNHPHVDHPQTLRARSLERHVMGVVVVPYEHRPVEVLALAFDPVSQLNALPAVELRELHEVVHERLDSIIKAALAALEDEDARLVGAAAAAFAVEEVTFDIRAEAGEVGR